MAPGHHPGGPLRGSDIVQVQYALEVAFAVGVDVEAGGRRRLQLDVLEQPVGPLLARRIDEQGEAVDAGRLGPEVGGDRVVDRHLPKEPVHGRPEWAVRLRREHLFDGLEADRLAGGAGPGDTILDRLDHRLGRRVHRIHQLVRQAHLGDAALDQLLALRVHGAKVVAEPVGPLGLDGGHLLDQRLQHGARPGAGLGIGLEQPAVGRVAQVVDARKLCSHDPRS